MTAINKHTSIIVLTLMAVGTVLNRYIIKDVDIQWLVAMLLISSYLVLFSYSRWKANKSKVNLILLIIFSIELIGVIFGYNLYTNYFPELILALCFLGLYTKLRNIKR